MTEGDQQQRPVPVGRPIQAPRPAQVSKVDRDVGGTGALPDLLSSKSTSEPPTSNQSDDANSRVSGRIGDSVVGRPRQAPSEMVVTAHTVEGVLSESIPASNRNVDLNEVVIEPIRVPSFFGGATGFSICSLLALLVGLFIVTQSMTLMSLLQSLPWMFRLPAYTFLLLLFALLAYTIWRFVCLYRQLKRNEQISMTRVRSMTDCPGTGEKAFAASKRVLRGYLENLDVGSQEGVERFETLGATSEQISLLSAARQSLLGSQICSSSEWIKEFERDVVDRLDQIAKARVTRYAKFVAVKTAISPNGLLDFVIVLYNNTAMLSDLCSVYQVRTSHLGTLYILCLVLFHSYVAGAMGDAIDGVADGATDYLSDALGGVGAKIAGKLAAKAAEGTANGLFTWRIGTRSLGMLRPIAHLS